MGDDGAVIDPITPEQDAARAALEVALTAFISAYDGFETGEHLGDWAFIAHLPTIEQTGRSEYFTGYHTHYVSSHIARGLFTEGARHCDEDDDTD